MIFGPMDGTFLLKILEEAEGGFVSGEALSRRMGVSRTAIWKQIRKLEAEGYAIEAVPRLGYRLAGKPPRLSPTALQAVLQTTRFGRQVRVFECVGSTQDILHEWAKEGAPEGALVISERQTSGRGRMGRTWISPAGKGVWMSLLLRPALPLALAPQLSLLASVAVARALKAFADLDVSVKWPNDLLFEGKKVCGVLLESSAENERLLYVVTGIGISANLDPEDFPEELKGKAISLKMACGGEVDRPRLIAAVLKSFEELYDLYREQGFEPIRLMWEALAESLHRPVELRTPEGTVRGTARGIDDYGALLVEREDGTIAPIYAVLL
jgi:BirA family biotin operon repressor/biotin-[acetyl-CoA-carboxylase] ligase